ncbi:MAG TPA: SPFH domain-containing protein [Gemmataceae bacterium]|nr:SPFH domain-containing protein [Gemmataceae bacterium]
MSVSSLFANSGDAALMGLSTQGLMILAGVILLLLLPFLIAWLTTRYIPNQQVGVVEKLWSNRGSVPEGNIIALDGEAGFQADVLRGGLHFGLWRWQYRVHKIPLVTIPQGKIGYVYARDGESLPPSQTLGRVVPCNNFQDARTFLGEPTEEGTESVRGQRGRQRAILREGVYAINPALFVVITEDAVYHLRMGAGVREFQTVVSWQQELRRIDGFSPVVVGASMRVREAVLAEDEEDAPRPAKQRSRIIGAAIPEAPAPLDVEAQRDVDTIAIVTVQDGPSLTPGEIIAPAVGNDSGDANYHNNYQDPEAFLRAGGRRGRQYVPLTDGTYFLNRWFATVEMAPKTVVPIGYVGVVVSYYGRLGRDLSGEAFRHGERVSEGERGVWERPLGPGKYPFNTYAGNVILVPTTNFVLHWITGRSEAHRYDESLRSIDLVTKDAYEPLLPLSVVVHIDYQKAPGVIQRFGDVKKLITQTLDPMLSAYFRDVAHKKTMLELLHMRDAIQAESREELRRKFRDFDIECVDVLIGKPDTAEAGGKIETLLEQLRVRQLSIEQLETYDRQRASADRLRMLNEAQAQAAMQTQLTNSRVQIQIAESQGEADLARARKQAEQTVVNADAELARSRRQAEQVVVAADAELAKSRRTAEQTVVTAEAEGQQRILAGRGEAQRVMQIGLSEATVLMRKIASFGDPRLYALSIVTEQLTHSSQPLVPERVFMAGANGDSNGSPGGASGMLGMLLNLLVAEKSGFQPVDVAEVNGLKEISERLTRDTLESLRQTAIAPPPESKAASNGPVKP